MTASEVAPPRRVLHAEWSALAALFALTVRQHTHGRRLLVLALLYLIPCALAVLLRGVSRAPADALEFALVLTLLPHGLAPLTALLYAAGVVSDEVEEQTLTYLLLRSVPRWELYLTKLLATLCVTVVLVSTAVLALYAAIYAGTPEFWSVALPRAGVVIGVMALAQFGYCALFGFLGLVTRRSLVGGIAYIVSVEGVLANLDFVGRSLTVVYYVRTLALRWLDLPAEQLRQCQESWGMTEMEKLPSSGSCVLIVLGVGAVVAAVSALRFARSEFHVKTPGSD
ncbi:MAG: ABC transporter permease subunit [Planctomycetes bacterium]|nr:ABC transporter permease subunit [Planctomycetota bacterium]